jgi:peptidoglycan/LPS O-acetylase OafA/YrhL
LTIAFSYLTWRFVERPGQALFRHWSDFIFVRRDSRVLA